MRKSHLIALALAGGLTMAAPAMADDPAPDAKLPTCSATVTDHCMQREHHAMAARHHMTRHHSHVRKHHAK
ncbi:MAG: hypothetical protein ACKOQM_06320 [Novosphingobium sp.]